MKVAVVASCFSIAAFFVTAETAIAAQSSVEVSPSAAQPAATTGSNATKAKPGTDDREICQTVEMTGSRLGGKRECHTRSEWAAMMRAQRDNYNTRGRSGEYGGFSSGG